MEIKFLIVYNKLWTEKMWLYRVCDYIGGDYREVRLYFAWRNPTNQKLSCDIANGTFLLN